MSSDNYFLVRRHPFGAFTAVQGFDSDDEEPVVKPLRHHQIPSISEAFKLAMARSPEYGVSVHQECWQPLPAPEIGELWQLAYDGEPLSLAVVSGVHNGFVTCWPVESADSPIFGVAIALTHPDGSKLVARPGYETGVSNGVLTYRYGSVIDKAQLLQWSAELDADKKPSTELMEATVEGHVAADYSDDLCDKWMRISNLEPKP